MAVWTGSTKQELGSQHFSDFHLKYSTNKEGWRWRSRSLRTNDRRGSRTRPDEGLLLVNYCKMVCSLEDDWEVEKSTRCWCSGWLDWQGGKQWRHEENRGICLGVYELTIRMSRRRRKIGAEAASLRARQDYLLSGGKPSCFVREEDTRTILWRK